MGRYFALAKVKSYLSSQLAVARQLTCTLRPIHAAGRTTVQADYTKPAIMESGRSERGSNAEGQRQATIPSFT